MNGFAESVNYNRAAAPQAASAHRIRVVQLGDRHSNGDDRDAIVRRRPRSVDALAASGPAAAQIRTKSRAGRHASRRCSSRPRSSAASRSFRSGRNGAQGRRPRQHGREVDAGAEARGRQHGEARREGARSSSTRRRCATTASSTPRCSSPRARSGLHRPTLGRALRQARGDHRREQRDRWDPRHGPLGKIHAGERHRLPDRGQHRGHAARRKALHGSTSVSRSTRSRGNLSKPVATVLFDKFREWAAETEQQPGRGVATRGGKWKVSIASGEVRRCVRCLQRAAQARAIRPRSFRRRPARRASTACASRASSPRRTRNRSSSALKGQGELAKFQYKVGSSSSRPRDARPR